MQEIIDKKAALEAELRTLEKQIYDLETNYIEETQNTGFSIIKWIVTFSGNIIKGWEGFLSNKNTKSTLLTGFKKIKCNPNDRIFSLSSCTSPAVKNS
jgi:Histone acetyltransferase subunit NuA4.